MTTVAKQQTSYALRFGPLGVLTDWLIMRRKLDRSIAEVFRSLKRYVEVD